MKMSKEKRIMLKSAMLAYCKQSVFELAHCDLAENPKIKDAYIAACWLVFHNVNKRFNFVFSEYIKHINKIFDFEGLDDANIQCVITKVYQV